MKYLKTFESTDKPYEKISVNELQTSLYGNTDEFIDENSVDDFISKNWVDFTTTEVDKIKEAFFLFKVEVSYDHTEREENMVVLVKDRAQYILTIYKLRDEWFYIWSFTGKYYRCDQIDGLIKCLKDVEWGEF